MAMKWSMGNWKKHQIATHHYQRSNCVLEQPVSAENPWPNTETKVVLVCRTPKKDDKPSTNEFVGKDGQICRWVVVDKK